MTPDQEKVLKRLEDMSGDFSKLMRKMAKKKGVTLNEVHASALIAISGSYQHAEVPKTSFLAEARDCWDNVKNRLKNETKVIN